MHRARGTDAALRINCLHCKHLAITAHPQTVMPLLSFTPGDLAHKRIAPVHESDLLVVRHLTCISLQAGEQHNIFSPTARLVNALLVCCLLCRLRSVPYAGLLQWMCCLVVEVLHPSLPTSLLCPLHGHADTLTWSSHKLEVRSTDFLPAGGYFLCLGTVMT
jgi:hypothetical protein